MSALAAFSASLRDVGASPPSDIVAEAARLGTFDSLVAARIGRMLEDAHRLETLAGPGPRTLHDEVRLQVALIRSTEIDDIELRACVTAGSVVAPVALILADRLGADDRSAISAMAAGYAAMVGLGRAINGVSLLQKGFWPTYLVAPFGAAATAAALLGLDARGFSAALALALARTSRFSGRPSEGASPRFHLLGCAAAEGVAAAQAAQAGFGGDPAALEDFGQAIGQPEVAAALAPADGGSILQMDVKPFPTARQGQASVEAFRSIKPASGRLSDIRRVVVQVPSPFVAMVSRAAAPPDRAGSLLSVACQLGLEGLGLIDDARRSWAAQGELVDFIARVAVEAAPDLDAAFPERWGGRVRVELMNGEVREACVVEPRGSAGQPFGWSEAVDKASRIVRACGADPQFIPPLQQACADFGSAEASRTTDRLCALGFG